VANAYQASKLKKRQEKNFSSLLGYEVIGDVMGKGVPAGLIKTMTREQT